MPFDRSTDLNFLRAGKTERGAVTLTAGVGGAHGTPVVILASIAIQGNYVNMQIFNAANTSEDFIDFFVDGVLQIKDVLVDQGGGGSESVTNIYFKSEIPKGSEVSASVRSSIDLSTVDLIIFFSGI